MATLRTVTVDPDDVGADYASLNAAESSEEGDISSGTGTDEYVVFECTSQSGSDDTTDVTFNGWTVGATFANRLEIQSPSGSRHSGDIDQSLYVYTGSITFHHTFGAFHHLQFVGSSANGSIYTRTAASGRIEISYNIFAGVERALLSFNNDADFYIWNCMCYESGSAGYQSNFELDNADSTYYVENCSSFDCGDGDNYNNGGTCTIINCIAGEPGTGDACFNGTYATGSDYNIASNSDDPGSGTNNQQNVTLTLADRTGDDYRLVSGDTEAVDSGTSSSLNTPISTNQDDYEGDSRTGSWDIGADELVSVTDLSINVADCIQSRVVFGA